MKMNFNTYKNRFENLLNIDINLFEDKVITELLEYDVYFHILDYILIDINFYIF